MNRSFSVAMLTVTMIIMMSTAGYSATGAHAVTCDNCHGKFLGSKSDTVAATNSCTTCHSSSGDASRMPVNPGDMANYFGNVPGQPSTGSRSSHTFLISSTIYNTMSPRANTVEPLATVLVNNSLHNGGNTAVLKKQVLCVRCHYAASDVNTTLGVSKPYLRSTSIGDALCLDCHRNRIASDTSTGSHPVSNLGSLRSYSSVYKSNTTAFRKIPLSPNPNNRTAMLGNYLYNNKVVCSTCHAVHYGDSNSSTLDNRSTANGFAQDDPAKGLKGQFQNSKGQLLRTDPLGATASAINVCSSCHKETANMNHNGRKQNIQCNHCHGAHVDYTDGDGSLKNLYLVRRDFSNMSTTKVKLGANVKVIYNTATSLRFKRADNKGICEICHALPAGSVGSSIHELPDTRAKECKDCHNHKNGFSAGDCNTCHGQPPMTSSVGGPDGKSSALYTLDESLAPHATHASNAYYNYACKNCHYDGTRQDSHNTSTPTFQSVFVDTTNSVGHLASGVKNIATDYNSTTRRCSNVYCHSNGMPRGGIAMKTYTTPSWEYGRNKIHNTTAECTSCHQSGPTLKTNAHEKHVTTNLIKCSVCHAATVNNATAITDRTKHANGAKDVKFATRPTNFFGVFSSSWNTSAGTCNNSCHSNGLGGAPQDIPKWTDPLTGDCGSCHTAAPITSLHPLHFTDTSGPNLGTSSAICNNCHVYTGGVTTTHANGIVNLKAGNSCAPCHPGISPIWMTGATVTCESCHTDTASIVSNQYGNYTAPLKPLNNTKGHGRYPIASPCTVCHNSSAPHIGAAPTEKRLKKVGDAVCTTCHISSVMGNMSTTRANLLVHGGTVNKFTTYTSAANLAKIANVRSDACAGCHDTHGTTNLMSVRTTINGETVSYNSRSTGLIVTTPNGNGIYNGLCQVCHTKVKYFKRNAAPDLSHNGGKDCLDCHTHKGGGKAGKYAFEPGGGCGVCHGYPPVRANVTAIRLPGTIGTHGNYSSAKFQDYSGGGGAHSVAGHIPKSAKETEAWTNCSSCHKDTAHMDGGMPVKKSFVNVVVDPKFKFNNFTAIKYNAQTCSNVSCHFKKTPNWTNGF